MEMDVKTLRNSNIGICGVNKEREGLKGDPAHLANKCSPVKSLLRIASPLPRQKCLSILSIKPYPTRVKPLLCTRKLQPRAPSPGLKPFSSWPGTQRFLGKGRDNVRYLYIVSLGELKDL